MSTYKFDIYDGTAHKLSDVADANKIFDVNNYDLHLMNACLFFATNNARLKAGKSSLTIDEKLLSAAQIHSYNMVKYNFFSHENKVFND